MQIVPLIQSTLNLAGYLAARGCPALARGQSPGVDIGCVRADGSMQLAPAAAHHEGALEQGRARLDAAPDGVAAQVLVATRRLDMGGTPFTDALVAECRDAGGQLAGLLVAMPFRPALGGRPLVMHPVRIVACPDALRPLSDELLLAFAQGLAAHEGGFGAWMRALEVDEPAPPLPPASLGDPGALACAIHAADPQADSDAKAAAHLQAFFDRAAFEGGLGYERALRALPLDFSLASLAAIDALLDRLHAERRPRAEAFLGAQAGLNFLHLVTIYLGETMAQAAGATIAWRTHAQLESVEPGRLDGEADAATALVCVFNAQGGRGGLVFLPLDVVACRLFGQPDAPTLAAAAEAALPAIRAARRIEVPELAARWPAPGARGEFAIARVDWLGGEALTSWLDDVAVTWRTGRLVRARLVQANEALFRPGPYDHPGEIVYDPSGRLDPDGLDALADRLYALKGMRPRHSALAWIAAHLTGERTRSRGLPVPTGQGARGALLSTVLFHRPHLPGGRLSGLQFPVVVSDERPGVAIVLPAGYWPDSLRASWAD